MTAAPIQGPGQGDQGSGPRRERGPGRVKAEPVTAGAMTPPSMDLPARRGPRTASHVPISRAESLVRLERWRAWPGR